MNNHSLKLTALVCVAAVVLQIVSLIIPAAAFSMFNMTVRPLVFAVLAAVVFAFMGRDGRPAPNAYSINVMAVIAAGLLGVVFLVFTFLMGAAINPMVPGWTAFGNNLWNFGAVVLLGEYIRYKLIKSAGGQARIGIAIALTVVLAFTHMAGGRALIAGVITFETVFISIFAPLVISGGASYFAVRGKFLSVALVGFTYVMIRYLLPVLPYVSPLTFSLITSGTMFVSLIICHFTTNEKSREIRIRDRRLARYAPKPVFGYAIIATALITLAAFFMGSFPVYPIVVLTGSMEPVLARGSLAFIERVPAEEVFDRVGEGYIIHFVDHGGTEYIHRVVGHWYNHLGERHYITQGDAGDAQDPFPIPQNNVKGIARATLPFFGYPYIFFRSIQRAFN